MEAQMPKYISPYPICGFYLLLGEEGNKDLLIPKILQIR